MARGAVWRPDLLLPVTFLLAILVGTLLLSLPGMATRELGPLDAFFTATSAVCVTGLAVVDTGTAFTPGGQGVILGLIQAEGRGLDAAPGRARRDADEHESFGTVGLSTGITPDLTTASKLVLCAVMFVGRVGSLSLFLLLAREAAPSHVRYPEERILVG